MRKLISMLVAVVMIVSAIPFTASANTYTSGNFTYNIAGTAPNQTVTITGLSNPSFTGALTIPATIATPQGTLSVTMIEYYSFYGTAITSVVIPDSVITISQGAFENCVSLTSVTIGKGVDRPRGALIISVLVGAMAFNNCPSLTSITFKATTAPFLSYYYGTGIFYGTNNIQQINVPYGTKAAYQTALQEGGYYNTGIVTEGCVHGTDLCGCVTYTVEGTAPNQTVTVMGLLKPTYAGDLVIPATINGLPVTKIGDEAFNTTLITSVDIPNSVEIIGNIAFSYCRYLTTLKFNREYPPVFALFHTWGVFHLTCDRVLTIYVPNNNAIALYKAVLQANDFNIRGIDFKTMQ